MFSQICSCSVGCNLYRLTVWVFLCRKGYCSGIAILGANECTEYETLVEIQYRNADDAHSKDSLLHLVSFMNQLQERQKIVAHRAFANDEGIALMRLALLEEKAGNAKDSQQYIKQTRDVFEREYHKNYSEDFLRKFVAKANLQPEI